MTPTLDVYVTDNGHGLTHQRSAGYETMNDALARLDKLTGLWRHAGYTALWQGVGLVVAIDHNGDLRAAVVFRVAEHHHRATAAAVEHVARHRDQPAALAALRADTHKEGAPR